MKKVTALLLAAVLVMGLSLTALAESEPLPKAVASYGFDKDEGFTLNGASLGTDGDRKVLTLTGGAAANAGQSGAVMKTDLFGKTDWTDGMTIAFWVKPANKDEAIAPLYSLDIEAPDDQGNLKQGYIAVTDSLELAINTDGNSNAAEWPRVWADPANVGPDAMPVLEAGQWQHVAVTLGSSGMTIYLNGAKYAAPALGSSSANFKLFVDQIQHCYGFELGSWNCEWWGDIEAFEGSYDDLYFFDTVLTESDVKAVMNASFDSMTKAASSGKTGSEGGLSPVVIVVIVAAVAAVAVVVVVMVMKKKKTAK